ncbi:MAG: hypothetical protein USCGTAYLOR_02512 [Chromatiales bacterium USCg_Taylor]|nr:MAG: hypothetical protein USCGTAYLOR_02512 [Chromatiales bacterium USCg_Taylor]
MLHRTLPIVAPVSFSLGLPKKADEQEFAVRVKIPTLPRPSFRALRSRLLFRDA